MDRYVAYLASAGTGKTYTLAVRYTSLLLLGENPNSILVVTFTKKATKEMKERIINFLTLIAKGINSNNKDRNNLIEALVRESGLEKKEIESRARDIYYRFLSSQNYIITLDSFFNSILKSTSLSIGIDPNYTLRENSHSELDRDFLREISNRGDGLLENFIELSTTLGKRDSKDLLNIFKELYFIEPTLPKSEYKLNNSKLLELEKMIVELFIEIGEISRELKVTSRATNQFNINRLNEIFKKSIFSKSSLREHRDFKKFIDKNPILEEKFLELKELIRSYFLEREKVVLYNLFRLFNSYKESRLDRIREHNEMDFEDMLNLVFRVTKEVERDFIYFKLDSKFKHILIDEFQDTSATQFLILEPLIDEIFSGVGVNEFRTLFYVGDTKQSLYRFRGANEELFYFVLNRYNIKLKSLDVNYRSAKNIVEFTNDTFQNVIDGYVKQSANSQEDGYIEVVKLDSKDKIDILNEILNRVETLINKRYNLEDIAILVFTNRDAIEIENHLNQNGIEATHNAKQSLNSNFKVVSLINLLKYAISKDKNRALIEPFLKLTGEKDIELKINGKTPFKILDEIILKNSYFQNDINIIKLLEFAKEYSTIERFLYDFERSKKSLAKENKGVKILTIHSSKGLEFKSVILVDSLSNKSNSSNSLIIEYKSPIEVKKIYLKSSKRENFDSEFRAILEAEKEKELKSLTNMLYVGVTRAKRNLFIISKDKSSKFSILNLKDIKIGEITTDNFIEKSSPRYKLPTEITHYGKDKIKEKDEDIEDRKSNLSAIYFGTALHYGLELANFESKSFSYAKEGIINRFGYILNSEQIEDILNRIKLLFNSKEFFSIIDGAKLFREQPLSYGGEFYRVDLLAKFKDKNIVVEYKSSYNFRNEHLKQLKRYIDGISKIEGKPTYGYLVYLLKDRVEIEKVI